MTDARVVAIGAPLTFRQQVAGALGAEPDAVEWVPTVSAAEQALEGKRLAPNVLVVSPAVKELDAFGLAEFVSRTSPATAVLLVRDRMLNGTLPAAMRAGIRDVIEVSRGSEELRDALSRALSWSENLRSVGTDSRADPDHHAGKLISIFSSKGGTGKTFLATSLASAIAVQAKQDTAVVDLDLDMGDVFSYFGREPGRPLQDLIALGDGADREAILATGTEFHSHLWGYGSPHDPTAAAVGGETMGKILRALRSTFDYTIIDATADYSDPALAAFDLSDEIFLITGLDMVGVRHLSVALQTLLSLGFPKERFRIVLNRADSKVGLQPSDVERVMKIRVDAMIPSSRLVPLSLNKGTPVVLDQPRSEVARSIRDLAQKLADVGAASSSKRGLLRRR